MLLENYKPENFKRESKDFSTKNNKNNEFDESFSSFLEEQEKNEKIKANKSKSIKFSFIYIFPILYLAVSILMPVVILSIKSQKRLNFEKSDIKLNDLVVTSYYELITVNSFIYRAYCLLTTLAGCAIVIELFLRLNQRFKVPEFKDLTLRLYVMFIFGVLSNIFNLCRGFITIFKDNFLDGDLALNERSESIFLGYILFSLLFSIYSLLIVDLIKQHQIKENLWYAYKIIIICFLVMFTLIYTIFLFWKNNQSKHEPWKIINENMDYVLAMFPYFIHSINALLNFSYFFEFKYLNTILSCNLDVDYLFEDSVEAKI
jgi:flagellar basal body-associated protein FliL